MLRYMTTILFYIIMFANKIMVKMLIKYAIDYFI